MLTCAFLMKEIDIFARQTEFKEPASKKEFSNSVVELCSFELQPAGNSGTPLLDMSLSFSVLGLCLPPKKQQPFSDGSLYWYEREDSTAILYGIDHLGCLGNLDLNKQQNIQISNSFWKLEDDIQNWAELDEA